MFSSTTRWWKTRLGDDQPDDYHIHTQNIRTRSVPSRSRTRLSMVERAEMRWGNADSPIPKNNYILDHPPIGAPGDLSGIVIQIRVPGFKSPNTETMRCDSIRSVDIRDASVHHIQGEERGIWYEKNKGRVISAIDWISSVRLFPPRLDSTRSWRGLLFLLDWSRGWTWTHRSCL